MISTDDYDSYIKNLSDGDLIGEYENQHELFLKHYALYKTKNNVVEPSAAILASYHRDLYIKCTVEMQHRGIATWLMDSTKITKIIKK